MMPGWTGFETCRRLKQSEATRSIPVVFITALGETKSMVEAFRRAAWITSPSRFKPRKC